MFSSISVNMKVRMRFRCYPTDVQDEHLAKVFGHCRYVFNKALEYRKSAYENGSKVGYKESSAALTKWKATEADWLKEVSCVPLQQSLRHLQSAYQQFFKGIARYPTFKKRKHRQSAEFTRSAFTWSVDDPNNPNLCLAKLGRLRVRWSRRVEVKPSTVTIIKEPSGNYFVSLTIDIPKPKPFAETGRRVGVDLGIKFLAILSDGSKKIDNPRHLRKHLDRLARMQRHLSRKKKGSARWHRTRVKVARLQERIANARKDCLDKLTTGWVKAFDKIVVEDLDIRSMLQRNGFAKDVADACMGMTRRMLEYKCQWYGRELIIADRYYASSKTCSTCGHKNNDLDLSVRKWKCPKCGTLHDRDRNAAINLESFGQSDNRHGERVSQNKALPLICNAP